MTDEPNPFLRFGLDPGASLAELTARVRELAEDATEEERVALRAAWDALSRSPARRFELVLQAGPAPAPLAVTPARPEPTQPWPEPTLRDVLGPPPLAPMLPPETQQEAQLRAVDLSFLVRTSEADVTGALGPKKR